MFSLCLFICHGVVHMIFFWPSECQDISKGAFKYYGLRWHKPMARHFLNHRIKLDVLQERESWEVSFQPEYEDYSLYFPEKFLQWENLACPVLIDFLVVCVPLFSCPCSCVSFKIMQLQSYINMCYHTSINMLVIKTFKQILFLYYRNNYSGLSFRRILRLHNKSQIPLSDICKVLLAKHNDLLIK